MSDQIFGKFKDFLDRKLLIDVIFVFKSNSRVVHEVAAHKLVLTASSPVFETMFTGSIPEESRVTMNDPEIDFKNFQAFIQYFYTKKIELNMKNVAQQAYLADKYAVESLGEICSDFFTEKLSGSNVYDILSIAERHRMEDLRSDCLELISTSTEAQKEEVFSKLSHEHVIGVIDNLPLYQANLCEYCGHHHHCRLNVPTSSRAYKLLQTVKNWLRMNTLAENQIPRK
ncbi:kelch-like ECH-associated protein 1 [Brevipalpus obovatus]|uniref:kelch-like ECH-associated protein 1 n=1 Tax=Brevipalpus obovatus TaxID=246614 RepID=UPI003D9E1136